MGAIGGLLGVSGGASGTGYATPQQSRVDQPITMEQAQQAYQANQQALAQQQAFLDALKQQNGIGNQSEVFNQLQGVANGTGPNPAQAMLAQSTGQNIANQAALMAGQRGAGQNVGMIARQAAQQGANTQQQAAGQAATLQANQSLSALGAMGNIAGQQVGNQAAATSANTQAQQNEQQAQLNSIAQANATRAGLQSNINTTNAGLASQTMQGQQNLIGNITGGAGAAFGLAEGGEVPHYESGGTVQPQITQPLAIKNGPKSKVGQFHFNGDLGNQPNKDNPSGMSVMGQTIGKAIGTGLKSLFSPSQATQANQQAAPTGPMQGPDTQAQSDYKVFERNQQAQQNMYQPTPEPGPNPMTPAPMGLMGSEVADAMAQHQANIEDQVQPRNMAEGGKVPAMVSPGEVYLDRKDVNKVARGADPIQAGERIPGKAKVKGNSYANDTVPKTLESGGIVLPKSVMEAAHPHWEAHKFVSAILAKQGKLPPRRRK